jgi:hypothetical protein
LALGIGAIVYGCVQSVIGFTDRDAAKHEATAPGVIVRVYHGKGTTYDYEFRVNGVLMRDSSGSCRTPLTPGDCKVGGQVLVYYTYEPSTDSKLEDFADASREALQLGIWTVPIGVLLTGGSLLARKLVGASESSEDDDDSSKEDDSEVISIAPKD